MEYLIDNIYVSIGNRVYRQCVGIPMGTDCAPLLANLFLLTLARTCAAKGYCSRSVGLSVCRSVGLCLCSHVFSRTVAAVDSKRGYVGICNGRSAQQESGAALLLTAGA